MEQFKDFRYWFDLIDPKHFDCLSDKKPTLIELDREHGRGGCDTPVEVFGCIRHYVMDKLRNGSWQRQDIIIDITGAKKSMMTGAYLFADFADIRVSYVDFDLYDQDWQRPYGFSCRIDTLESPSKGYHLDAWRRVREHYRHSAFGSMLDELTKIVEGMNSHDKLFVPRERNAVNCLIALIRAYKCWVEGDYCGAWAEWQKADLAPEKADNVLPTAIGVLRQAWSPTVNGWPLPAQFIKLESGADPTNNTTRLEVEPKTESEDTPNDKPSSECTAKCKVEPKAKLKESLFDKPDLFRLYARDEVEKIRLLIKHTDDYRSALLRAAGLHEVILKYHLVQLWLKKKVETKWKAGDTWEQTFDSVNALDVESKSVIEQRIASVFSATRIARFLCEKKYSPLKLPGNPSAGKKAPARAKQDVKLHRTGSAMTQYWDDLPLSAFHLAEIRNKAIHFTVPVSKSLANDAFMLVSKGLDVLEQSWFANTARPLEKLRFKPPWTDLCKACNIDFLPPD